MYIMLLTTGYSAPMRFHMAVFLNLFQGPERLTDRQLRHNGPRQARMTRRFRDCLGR